MEGESPTLRKAMAASPNMFYGRMWDGFCLNT